MQTLTQLGRVRLSKSFFMRDMLHSEIAQIHGLSNVPDNPVEVLRARHEAQGLVLDARTATPEWLGERLDVGWAIDVLHPLAR